MNSLVDFRNSKNLTQRQMSQKIGVTLSYYSKIELSLRNPSYDFIKKFKTAFKSADIERIFFSSQLHETCLK